MANQIPIKVMCDGSGNTCGLAQFTSSDSVAIAAGGTGLTSQGICEFVQPGLYAVGCQVTYLGICAGKADTGAGHDNTYVGYAAGTAVTTGCQHTLIGKGSGIAITTCSGTVAVGHNTANALTFGMHNTYVGNYAGASGSIPNNNTFIGFRSGVSNGCNNNTGVGTCSLAANDRGEDNTAIGANAGATQLHQGCDNVFVGSNAGAVSLCSHNVSIGSYAGKAATTGTGNVMIGACVGYGVVGGASNVYIGDKAGLANTGGNANVFIGNCAGCASTASCCLIIGNGTCDLITGNFNSGLVGIGTASPAKLLDITGDNNSARVGQVINQNGTHDAELQMHVVGGSGGGNYSMHVGGASGSIAGDWGLYDNDAAAYRMVVLSDGKIGIATATPGPGLVTMGGGVAGDTVRIDIDGGSDNGKGAQLAFQSGGTDKFYVGDTASLQGGSESSRDMSLYTTSGLGIRFYTGGNNRRMDITSDGDLQMASGSDIIQESGSDMNFKVSVNRDIIFSDTAEIARFTGDGGYLGIGTAAPAANLHVEKANAGAVSTGGNAQLIVENSSHAGIQFNTPVDSSAYIYKGDPGATVRILEYSDYGEDALLFYVQDTEVMHIKCSCGLVGLGTSNPDGKLHIYGASAGTETASTYGDLLVIEDDTDNGMTILTPDGSYGQMIWQSPSASGAGISTANARIAAGYNGGSPRLDFSVGATGNMMTLLSAGYVGVGAVPTLTTSLVEVNGAINVGAGNAGQTNGGNISSMSGTVVADGNAQALFQGISGGAGGAAIVSGYQGTRGFVDIVVYARGKVAVASSTTTDGSPPARSYAVTSENVTIAMSDSSLGWTINYHRFGVNEQSKDATPNVG